jgi:hypothetical protein
MATFEKVSGTSGGTSTTSATPRIMAVFAALAMVGLVVLGIVLPFPVAAMCFGVAVVLAIYLLFIGGAFYLDRRRRRNHLLGR